MDLFKLFKKKDNKLNYYDKLMNIKNNNKHSFERKYAN